MVELLKSLKNHWLQWFLLKNHRPFHRLKKITIAMVYTGPSSLRWSKESRTIDTMSINFLDLKIWILDEGFIQTTLFLKRYIYHWDTWEEERGTFSLRQGFKKPQSRKVFVKGVPPTVGQDVVELICQSERRMQQTATFYLLTIALPETGFFWW